MIISFMSAETCLLAKRFVTFCALKWLHVIFSMCRHVSIQTSSRISGERAFLTGMEKFVVNKLCLTPVAFVDVQLQLSMSQE